MPREEKPTITAEEFARALVSVVDSAGEDFAFDVHGPERLRISYLKDGQPFCIIGQALATLGYELDPRWDSGKSWGSWPADRVLQEHFSTTRELRSAANSVQLMQDRGKSFGDARDVFFLHYPELRT